MRSWWLALAMLALFAGVTPQPARAQDCGRDAFAAVVDEAGDALRTLSDGNTPRFQSGLRRLKEKQGWSDEEFLARAREYVEDPQIVAYDEIAGQFLANIDQLGDEGGGRKADCNLLIELRGHLFGLVIAMKAKWAYMFGKLEQAMAGG